jgi:zinc protease
MDQIKPMLESRIKGWKKGKTPQKNVGQVELGKSKIYLVDKPGALQSIIIAGHVAPPRGNPDDLAFETMNTILGGTFISRLNLNLREDKHWSYGARTFLLDAQGQRPFLAFAPVQTDKTKESMIEILKELEDVTGGRPITDQELSKIKDKQVLELPGSWETNNAVAASITEMVRFDLGDDYFDKYAENVRSLSLDQVAGAAKQVIHPQNVVWLVVGDREKIEPGLRDLGFGEIAHVDADGNPVADANTMSAMNK